MAVELNIRDDFSTILDGFEAVTVRRRHSAALVAVPKAWRYSSLTDQAEADVAGVARSDVVWQFAWDDAIDQPCVGDAIIDAANECWTILAIEERGAKTRLLCRTRNLRIVHELVDRIDVQQAIWEDSGSGPEIVGWTTLRTAVPARIQPDQVVVDNAATPPTSTATYRVLLGEPIALDHNHRIVGPDGSVYEMAEYAQAERVDTLPIATVTKLPSS